MTAMRMDLNEIIAAFRATGRGVHLYPRKRRISINGKPSRPIPDAIKEMTAIIRSAS